MISTTGGRVGNSPDAYVGSGYRGVASEISGRYSEFPSAPLQRGRVLREGSDPADVGEAAPDEC